MPSYAFHPAPAGAKCPECGADLSGQDVAKHATSHWPQLDPNNPNHAGAIAKRNALMALEDKEQK